MFRALFTIWIGGDKDPIQFNTVALTFESQKEMDEKCDFITAAYEKDGFNITCIKF